MNSLESNTSRGKDGNQGDRSTVAEHGDSAESVSKYHEWAENWFGGNACCPFCGGDDMRIVRTRGDDLGRIENWRCASPSCASGWRVELRECALGIYRDADGIEADWYERTGDASTFRIIIEGGRVTGIQTPEGSARPDPFPQFIVREYTKWALDEIGSKGTDAEGRDYREYRLPDTKEGDATPAVTHSLLVASTGHVTAEEAQALSDRGYARGEDG